MRFKTFLETVEHDNGAQQINKIDVHSAIEWMNEHSTEYLRRGLFLYRGASYGGSPYFLGSTKGMKDRTSKGTYNYYTLWMDNDPDFAEFPKRSKSFICTNSSKYAESYGTVFLVVPKDAAKIGFVGENDIWGVKLASGYLISFMERTASAIESVLGEGPKDKNWQDFKDALIACDQESLSKVPNEATWWRTLFDFSGAKNLYDIWEFCFGPKLFQLYTGSTLPGSHKGSEHWVQDDCVFISLKDVVNDRDFTFLLEYAEDFPELKAKLEWAHDKYSNEINIDVDADSVSDRDILTFSQRNQQRN